MKIRNIVPYAALLLSILAVGFTVYKQPRIAYIEMGVVYDNFKLKKDLEEEMKKVQFVYDQQADSLQFLAKTFYNELSNRAKVERQQLDSLEKMERQYQYKVKQKEEVTQKLNEEYNEQIWKRINQYVTDFGRKNKYEYILGANGTGSIMYANDAENLTEEVILYINAQLQDK